MSNWALHWSIWTIGSIVMMKLNDVGDWLHIWWACWALIFAVLMVRAVMKGE